MATFDYSTTAVGFSQQYAAYSLPTIPAGKVGGSFVVGIAPAASVHSILSRPSGKKVAAIFADAPNNSGGGTQQSVPKQYWS